MAGNVSVNSSERKSTSDKQNILTSPINCEIIAKARVFGWFKVNQLIDRLFKLNDLAICAAIADCRFTSAKIQAK